MGRLLIVVITLLFVACASVTPTAEQFEKADYGPYPDDYSELAAQLPLEIEAVGEPEKFWVPIDDKGATDFIFGYRIKITYRTKKMVRHTEAEPVDTPTGTVIQERVTTTEEMVSESGWWFLRDGKIFMRLMNVID